MTTDLISWTDQVNILDPVQWRRCWGFQVLTDQWIVLSLNMQIFSCSDATHRLLFRLKATLILVAVPLRPAMTCATFLFCVCRKGLFGQIAVKRSLKLDMLAFHNTLEGFLRYSYESNYCRCQYSLMFPTDSLETAWQQLVGEWRQIIIDWLFIYVSEPR